MWGWRSPAARSASRMNRSRNEASLENVRAKNLQGLLAGQPGMLDQVDLAHSAGTQQPQNPVPGEGLTDPQRHGRMLDR